MVIDDFWRWRWWSLLRRELGPVIGNQEFDIEGGVNANPFSGLWDVQGVGRGSDFLQHFEGTIAKIFQLLHLSSGTQIFHV